MEAIIESAKERHGTHDKAMTNLLMAVATILVTNTTEELTGYNYIPGPCPEGRIGCAVMHGIPSGPPTKKIVSTTVDLVTNAVHATLPNPIEIGRCPLVVVRQEFDWVTKAEWQPRPPTTNMDFTVPKQASVFFRTNSSDILWFKTNTLIVVTTNKVGI